jgi:hypothetical protein
MYCQTLGCLAMFELHRFKMIVSVRISLESNAVLPKYKFKMVGNVQNVKCSIILLFQLLHCMETESVGRLLRGGEWGDLVVPLPALADGLRQHQMDVVRLALSLHSQGVV